LTTSTNVDFFSRPAVLTAAAHFRVQSSGCRLYGSGFRVQGSGCRLYGSGIRVQGAGFRVYGPAFWTAAAAGLLPPPHRERRLIVLNPTFEKSTLNPPHQSQG